MEKNEKVFTYINYIFFSAVIVACIVLAIAFKLNWLTTISCVAGILYIVFLSDRSILNFIVGFISSTTYIIVAFQAKLYGEVIFYLIVDLPMIFISFFMWKKHTSKDLRVASRKLNLKQILITLAGAAVFTGLYAWLLKVMGGVNYIVDAISTVVSFIATLLMALRYREQWIMWVIVYIVSIIMWAITFDLLMLIMSISCFLSCLVGFVNWTIEAKRNETQTLKKTQTKKQQ